MTTPKKIALFIIISVLACALLLYVAFRVDQVMDYPDFLVYWLAGDLLNSGESPYNQVLWSQRVIEIGWFTDQTFLYPMPTAMFFTLWARLSYRYSYMLWMFLSMALVISALLLVMSRWKYQSNAVRYILPAIAGLIVFRPFLVSIRNGQIGGLLLFILGVVVVFWRDRKWLAGGILFSFLLMKPNIALPVMGLFGVYLLIAKRWSAIAGIAAGSGVFLSLGLIVSSRWISDFLEISRRKLDQTFGFSPTVWGFSHQICSKELSCTIPVGGVIAVLFVVLFVRLVMKVKIDVVDAGAMIIPLSLLVSPFGWAYEQVLLVYPIVWIMGKISEQGPFLAASLIFIGFSILSIGLLILSMSLTHDAYSFIVPLVCYIGMVILVIHNHSFGLKNAGTTR